MFNLLFFPKLLSFLLFDFYIASMIFLNHLSTFAIALSSGVSVSVPRHHCLNDVMVRASDSQLHCYITEQDLHSSALVYHSTDTNTLLSSVIFSHIHSSASSNAPKIKTELENLTVRVGEPFELRAKIEGSPTPMVQWMKG